MHQHLPDDQHDSLRPKAARLEAEGQDQLGRAAAAGRTDVLGPDGILGLQRAVGNAGVTAMLEEDRSPVHDVISSGGRPLEPAACRRGPREPDDPGPRRRHRHA